MGELCDSYHVYYKNRDHVALENRFYYIYCTKRLTRKNCPPVSDTYHPFYLSRLTSETMVSKQEYPLFFYLLKMSLHYHFTFKNWNSRYTLKWFIIFYIIFKILYNGHETFSIPRVRVFVSKIQNVMGNEKCHHLFIINFSF